MQVALEHSSLMPPRTDTQPRVALPVYVLPLLVTLLLAFLANLSYSLYWAGQIASNQANMVETLRELKTEVRELRTENQQLREQVAGLTASTASTSERRQK